MAGFLTPLRVERVNGGNKWRVLEPFEYCIGAADSKAKVIVPIGFETDFASIPRGLWNLFPPVGGKYDKAACIHDRLYQSPVYDNDGWLTLVDRKFADSVFKEAMEVQEVGRLSRWAIYSAVRLGGRGIWRNYREKELT